MSTCKILILSQHYIDKSSANAICVQDLIEGFNEIGISVDIVCFDDNSGCYNDGNNNIYKLKFNSVKKNFFYYLKSVFFNLFNWPIKYRTSINNMYKLTEQLYNKNKYDAIIAVHSTFISPYVMSKLKIESFTKRIVYLLDPISEKVYIYYKGYRRLLFWLVKIKEKLILLKSNYFIVMKCYYKKINFITYKFFKNKFKCFDFPLINFNRFAKVVITNNFNIRNVQFVLIGNLNEYERSTSYFIKLFNILNKNVDYIVNTHCKGLNQSELINHIDTINIIDRGLLNNTDLLSVINNYDIFINIGNNLISMLPSKIFQMFMTGKPIIHFAKSKEDCCNEYMERYGNALIIYEEDDLDYSLNRLLEFLKDYKIVPIEKVKEIFKENTPEYQANLIKELVLDN